LPSKSSKVVLIQHSDVYLNGFFPDYARVLDNQMNASRALGSVFFERSYRSDELRLLVGQRLVD